MLQMKNPPTLAGDWRISADTNLVGGFVTKVNAQKSRRSHEIEVLRADTEVMVQDCRHISLFDAVFHCDLGCRQT
jgi:hypothetical protein